MWTQVYNSYIYNLIHIVNFVLYWLLIQFIYLWLFSLLSKAQQQRKLYSDLRDYPITCASRVQLFQDSRLPMSVPSTVMSYPNYMAPSPAAASGASAAPITMLNVNSLLNQKDSRWLQLEVCREYQRQKCSRPDGECKFAHPPPNVEVQNGRVTACYDSIKVRIRLQDVQPSTNIWTVFYNWVCLWI